MKKFFVILKTIILWFVFIAGLSMIGIGTDSKNKALVLALYFLFFVVVFGTILMIIRSRQGRLVTVTKQWILLPKILGMILILVGLLFPALILGRIQIPNLIPNFFMVLLFTLILVAIGAYAIKLINSSRHKASAKSVSGYVLLVAGSCVPGFLISRYDSSNDTIGVIYFAAIFVSVLCWWGYSLLKGHQHEI
jgi:hypothetical protein